MKNINKYEVKILKNGDKTFIFESIEVVCENEEYLILKDASFTKLQKKSGYCNICPVVGKHTVSEWKMGFDSLDGIHYTLYTYKTKRPETIKSDIQKFINENYSYIFEVDLSFIK